MPFPGCELLQVPTQIIIIILIIIILTIIIIILITIITVITITIRYVTQSHFTLTLKDRLNRMPPADTGRLYP